MIYNMKHLKNYEIFENNDIKDSIINNIREIFKEINRVKITTISLLDSDFTDKDTEGLIFGETDIEYRIVSILRYDDVFIDEYYKDIDETGTERNTYNNTYNNTVIMDYDNLSLRVLKRIQELLNQWKIKNKIDEYDI